MSDPVRPWDREHGGGSRPRISVVTPVYNGAEFLEDCLGSVLRQGYSELEYIVIDGGSSDGTVDTIRRHEDRLAFWTSESDEGQADALNKGFRRATGELVCWLNADDFFYPGALSAAAAAYLADPQAPFYFGNGYRVDQEGHELAEFFPDGRVLFRFDALLFGLNYILQPSTLIRREALEEVGLLDTTLHYGFDTDLWIRLSALGQPAPIKKHLSASREYGSTKTSTGSFGRAEELRRIAERHSNAAATPGAVCYYLDTLHRFASKRPDVFPPEYLASIESLWSATAELLTRYGARPDGFPVRASPAFENVLPPPRPKGGRLRVGVELRQVTRGASGGIVAVLVGTLQELFKRRPDIEFVLFCTVFNRELLSDEASNVHTITLPLQGFFPELARVARASEIDLLLRSYPTVEEVDFPLRRQIFLLPDVQHEFHPEFFDAQTLRARKQAFRNPLEGAGAIMTISEYARQTIEQHAAPEPDVFVASPSLPPEFVQARAEAASEEEKARLPAGDFFFYPANLWPHKNHEGLFEALRRFRERTGRPIELVLTGAPHGWEELRERHRDLPITHLGYVSPPLLRLIYARSVALTFFSRYEGFGIPLLEAFHVGTPVVCSNTTSLPEVAGDATLMCDPTDIETMSKLLERIASDGDLRDELVRRGKQRLEVYKWSEAADELASGIERVLKRAKSSAVGMRPLVSIITPSYNHGRFLRRTIESVLAQTYSNIEYIVVDGASTDETLDILRSYGDRIRWISEPDSGQTEAINKGLQAVRGDIVGYLNSDDLLLPQSIEKVVTHFRDHPACDLVYGDADYIDEDDCVIGSYATADYSFGRLMEDCCICQPAAYWRVSAGAAVGRFDERLQYAMDYDFWIRFDRAGFAIRHLADKIAQSRLHPDAKTLRARREIYREVFDVCRRGGGYISRTYVDGLWHHLVYERQQGALRVLARFPEGRAALVSLHYRWLNRHLYKRRQWVVGTVRAVRRRVIDRLRRTPALFALLLRLRAAWRLRARRPRSSGVIRVVRNGRVRVKGYWPDNWVESRLEVVVDAREESCQLQLVGIPVVGMTVDVSATGGSLGQFDLSQDGQQRISVQLPPGPRETVTFAFSDHFVDDAGRPISFLLQETNTFAEEDLHAVV